MLSGSQGKLSFTPESACAYLSVCFKIDEQLRAKEGQPAATSRAAVARASEVSVEKLLEIGALGSLGQHMPIASSSKVQASGSAQHPNSSWVSTAHIPATFEPLQNSVDWQKTLQENISVCTDDILSEETQKGSVLFKNMREIAKGSTTSKSFLDNLQALLVILEMIWMGKNSAGQKQEKVCENLMSFLHSPIIKGWVKSAFTQQNHKENSLISSNHDRSSQLSVLRPSNGENQSALSYSGMERFPDSRFHDADSEAVSLSKKPFLRNTSELPGWQSDCQDRNFNRVDSSNSRYALPGAMDPYNCMQFVPTDLSKHKTPQTSFFGEQIFSLEPGGISDPLNNSPKITNAKKRKASFEAVLERQVQQRLDSLPNTYPFDPLIFDEAEEFIANVSPCDAISDSNLQTGSIHSPAGINLLEPPVDDILESILRGE